MTVTCKHQIMTSFEGPLDEVINVKTGTLPSIEDVKASLGELAFIVETIAHLQGHEELLKSSDKARAILNQLDNFIIKG